MNLSKFIFNGLLVIKQWAHADVLSSGDFLYLMRNDTVTKVLMLGSEEWEWNFSNVNLPDSPSHSIGQAEKVVRLMESILIERDIELHIVQGSKGPMPRFSKTPTINTTLHYWPIYWAYGTEDYKNNSKQGNKLSDPRQGQDIIPLKIATTLLNKGHKHRCQLMDVLQRDDFLSKNGIYFSWHNHEVKRCTINNPDGYKFLYWKENDRQYFLDNTFESISPINQEHPTPREAYLGAIHIVSESQAEGIFWTEKTWNPIKWGVPFVIISGCCINKDLELYGFELYTELFDYKFDEHPSYLDRLEDFMSQLTELRKKYSYRGGLQDLRRLVEPKVHRNRERLKEIIFNRKFIPPIVLSLLEQHGAHKEDWEIFHMNMQHNTHKENK
jgi:hypothetical protein